MAGALKERPGQGSDVIVWLYNWSIQRGKDGSWTAWLEPLPEFSDGSTGPEIVVSGVDASETQTRMLHAIAERLNADEGTGFRDRFSRPVPAKDIPAREWPPPTGFLRNLDRFEA